jgi:chemotaxis protein histidine kinase CheA
VVDLGQLLGFNRCEARHGYHHAAIISNGRQRVALSVSQVIGRRELFVKETALSLTRLPAFGGASLLGDGRVVIILDIDDLLHLATTSETKAD